MQINLNEEERFESRHIGPNPSEIKKMTDFLGVKSLDDLIAQVIPEEILLKKPINLPKATDEYHFIRHFRKMVSENKVYKSYIGLGYYDTVTPPVIQRNVFENPGWYTAYTPYQAEIAQGRLEALINFQQMILDLTGLEIANASLLDEGTAAAEAMNMFFSVRKGPKKNASKFFVDKNVFPQTLAVLQSRANPLGIELVIDSYKNLDWNDEGIFGALVQYPDSDGAVVDYTSFIEKAKAHEILTAVAADLMSLVLLKTPGEMGADAAVGTTQRFGVPMGYGGPHAAYFATRDAYKRQMPGRIIGVSVDANGKKAYRMALQTREQHIKRERATSNICTAQVLLAVMAGMYAVYHGPENLKKIALRIHGLARKLEESLIEAGFGQENEIYFDTLKICVDSENQYKLIRAKAEENKMNFRYIDDACIGISLDETTRLEDVEKIANIFRESAGLSRIALSGPQAVVEPGIPGQLLRKSSFLTHPVFNSHHSEHEMLRYLKKLENKDLSLVHSMIPLGSCTMKLNAVSEMIPLSWDEINHIHPFAPESQTNGYALLLKEMERYLNEITGMDAVSFQPNSGAQGELAGLLTIRSYFINTGQAQRNVALIPASAHGTNPASAVMAGMKVAIVASDENGNIDVEDLEKKAEQYRDTLAALMVTYPSTHGVYEERIVDICRIVHKHGGQVYMDGANMNAQVGLTNPGIIGADVCHLNLHKTFSIPHGGGGPGMGPICVKKHLIPYLAANPAGRDPNSKAPAVSSAPYSSASIIAISYAYISMMGVKGLENATKVAILNANYIKKRLEGHYPVLYTGKNGWNAHEAIIDCRAFKKIGVEVEDIAKRLMDYGYHAPTVSFPAPGTLMIEPTESESLEELDRFCDALISIRKEIEEIETGKADKADNVLKNAPHTAMAVMADEWTHPYSREKAAYPLPYLKENKFWPSSARIDNAYGDRNLWCACIPVSEYEQG